MTQIGRTFVIAEAGVNHNGDLSLAVELVEIAARAGADAVKFQTFRAEKLATASAPKARYQIAETGDSESQLDMLKRLELDQAAHYAIMRRCDELGIEFMSTPFDEESAEFLARLGLRRLKLPSGEITNLPFMAHCARLGVPLIVSTGMSDLEEVGQAVSTVRKAGCSDLTLLHCVTQYPADPAESNLRAMATMRDKFGCPVGWSDHTSGTEIALAAVALGATVVEKHFTKSRHLAGPDHRASLEPSELDSLIRGIRQVESAIGDGHKRPMPGEIENRAVARKSLVAARAIRAGTLIAADAVAISRPGTGIPPAYRDQIVGKVAAVDIAPGAVLTIDMVA